MKNQLHEKLRRYWTSGRRFVPELLLIMLLANSAHAASLVNLESPDASIHAIPSVHDDGRLMLTVFEDDKAVVAASQLGIVVDGADLGSGVELGREKAREIHEVMPRRGVKSMAVNHCMEYLIPVTVRDTGFSWTLEIRVFNDGVAFRYHVPGKGVRRINGEATAWKLPEDWPVWLQNNTSSYEGNYYRSTLKTLHNQEDAAVKHIGCPLTFEQPGGGYLLITEACLYRYSGMTLKVEDATTLKAVFQDNSSGWDAEGDIVSPWRVTILSHDLNGLVNTDLIYSLGEAPDRDLFPAGANTEWIQPGRGLITWAVFFNDGAQWWRQKWFVDMCVGMKCEYLLVDGGWRTERWGFLSDGGDLWARLEELCEYAAERNVGIFVWNAYPEGRDDGPGLTDPAERLEFFQKCKAAGVKGVKIDFFQTESKAMVDVYESMLRETAELQLMINFHGTHKPTGEVRTWPHEITREGIREQEYVLWSELPLVHYGALPFTRMVAGHGDFLPGFVRPQFLRNTTAVFQLATAVIFTSPFICWPDHPEAYLDSAMLPVIRSMPPVWDETLVLECSAIGETVAMARRSGTDWYVSVLNCQAEPISLDIGCSFLGEGEYTAMVFADREGPAVAYGVESGITVTADQRLNANLKPGGGFVARLSRPPSYTE